MPTWGQGNTANAAVRLMEVEHEKVVSAYIGSMPFLWLPVDDEVGGAALRAHVERNTIGLLSNFEVHPIDPPSHTWLGHFSDRPRVRLSGLWNQNHVDESYDPTFLTTLKHLISKMEP